MANNKDDASRDSAPDLKILGDQITLQPSGYVEPPPSSAAAATAHDEEALMKHTAHFRSEPLQFLREVSLYVSGTGWRAYDHVIGQPIFYQGFSENMKNAVLSAPLLNAHIARLAERRLAVEESQGTLGGGEHLKNSKDYVIRKSQRRSALEKGLREVAEKWTDEMICKFESKTFIRGAYYLITQLLTRAYHQGIHVSSEEVIRLRRVAEQAAAKKQSIVFLPCHRSHVDYVSMQLICYRLGIALPVVVAGDNLNFPLVGSFLQHAGAFYIRRAFGDDVLYATLVQTYIDTLLQGGFNLECFIEGGRSRTGKLLPPMFGILGFIIDSLLSGRVEDTIICPVSTQYDKVIETEGYVTELLGVPKKKENLADFLSGGSSMLSLRLGRVDVRFHEPWSLRGFINDQLSRLGQSPSLSIETGGTMDPVLRQKLLRTLGYKVLADINAVSVVMPTALIGTVLLTLRGRGVGKTELIRRVEWLIERVRAKGGRVAHFGNAPLSVVIERGLEVLGKDLVGVAEGLAEPTYYAVDRFQLSFYRNMTIHLFITEALVSAAMYTRVKQGGGPAIQDISMQDLRDQVLFLSSLFRGEFIFSGEGLSINLQKTLVGLEADKVITLKRDETSGEITSVGLSDVEREVGRENYDFYCFLIWPFIESSWLAAVSLMGLTPPPGMHNEVWIEVSKAQNSAQLLGKTLYHQGDLSYFEAVNKETLKNSYKRFEEEGIIDIVKSKDAKIPPRLRLSPEWQPPRDPQTGNLKALGSRLWVFTEKIAASRREGKNRRNGATVSTRVVRLTDILGTRLFVQAVSGVEPKAKMKGKGKARGRIGGEDVVEGSVGSTATTATTVSHATLSSEDALALKKSVREGRRRRSLEKRAKL
ncbi:acyltransferase-domain-containing protein [Coniella lustricola]|uniref:Acyltransferase-domain-containing protein n=1 Tax=Coniella lustricola TaxID=2025994 RepID=A0A2T2ZSJ9_9PEZI|nr:acyltransferase-domain-containing protein [Coniella lustricola]